MTRRTMAILQLIICSFLLVDNSFQNPTSNSLYEHSTEYSTSSPTNIKPDICDRNKFPVNTLMCTCSELGEKRNTIQAQCFVVNSNISTNNSVWNLFNPSQKSLTMLNFIPFVSPPARLVTVPTIALQSMKKLQNLSFDEVIFTNIPEQAFYNMPNIKEINLEKNNITNLPSKTFDSLNSLVAIRITKNNITVIKKGVFVGLTGLLTLDLSQNEIQKIEDNSFESLVSLKDLNLSNNKITEVTINTFFGLDKLENLNMSFNELTSIKIDNFKNMKNIKTINLDNNKIKTFDYTVSIEYNFLENLYLNNNQLVMSADQDSFAGMSNLKSLDLSNNGMKNLRFPNMKTIYANNINSTTALKLDLQGNDLTCNSDLSWMFDLKDLAKDSNLKKTMADVTCFLVDQEKNVATNNDTTPMNETNMIDDGPKTGKKVKLGQLKLVDLPIVNTSKAEVNELNQKTTTTTTITSSSAKVQIFLAIQLITLSTFLI